jgi:NodT family efflux transporter outer membrane factor (OMF) lipoprotein
MHRFRFLVPIAVTVLACACTVGPEYRPSPPLAGAVPQAFTAHSPATSIDAPPDAWWRLYNDPALDALVQQALVANTDLRVALANLGSARAALDQARAGRLPTTTATAGTTYGVILPSLLLDDAAHVPPKADWAYEPGLSASWEIDIFGRVRRSVQAASADVEAQAAAVDAVRVSVAAETARAYADACSFAASVAVQRHSLALAEQGAEITRTRKAAGAVSIFEVARAESLAAQTKSVIPGLEAQRRNAIFRLAVLTGQPPEASVPAAEQCSVAPILASPLPVGDGNGLLARRPDVREAERRLAGDTYRIGVVTADLYPRIVFGASASAAASTAGGLTTAAARLWSIGPMLSWDFPNQTTTRARIRASKSHAEASLAAFDGTVLAALRDVEQAMTVEAADLDRRDALREARDHDAQAVRTASERFHAGAIDSLDELDAQRTLITDDAALAQADQTVASDEVLLFKALGGGWQETCADAKACQAAGPALK